MHVKDWDRFLRQCYAHLKPGGWCEIAVATADPKCDDGTFPADSAIRELSETSRKACLEAGLDLGVGPRLKTLFKDAGFENVQQTPMKVPCSPWAKDAVYKEIGRFESVNMIEGAKNFLPRAWITMAGKSEQDVAMLVYRLESELRTNKQHCYNIV